MDQLEPDQAMSLYVMDFFTKDRLKEHECKRGSVNGGPAVRAYNCLRYQLREWRRGGETSLRDFLEEYPLSKMRRIPNLGPISIKVIADSLSSAGLHLQD